MLCGAFEIGEIGQEVHVVTVLLEPVEDGLEVRATATLAQLTEVGLVLGLDLLDVSDGSVREDQVDFLRLLSRRVSWNTPQARESSLGCMDPLVSTAKAALPTPDFFW